MQGEEQKFEIKLPARITGLVFWGLVFVGLLFAVIFLQRAETDIVKNYEKDSQLIAYQVEELLERYYEYPVLDKSSARIRAAIIKNMDDLGYNAVRIYEEDITLSVGAIADTDTSYEYPLHYYSRDTEKLYTLKMVVYCENAKDVVARIRKNFLLSIGLGVFVFGFFLQSVLQKMLSSPFQKMVLTAEKFSQGHEDVRFHDQRPDEFGYLAKFINNAIDTIYVEKERAEVTLQSITDTVVTVDTNGKIDYINPAGEALLGCAKKDVLTKEFTTVFNVVDENTDDVLLQPILKSIASSVITHFPEHSSLKNKDGSLVSIEASIAPMKSKSGKSMGAAIVIQDVSHTRRLTKQLSYQASHDLLTGLYNRRKFEEHLEEILIDVREEDRHHSLFYLDLDNFKIVNDTCGHVAGDELLKQLPAQFNKVLRSGDVIARLGGDEFGIILRDCELKQAANIADKIRQKIKDYRFIWEDRVFEIGVSIGVIGINAENAEMSQVLSSADVACYAAKDSGRNRVHVYEPSDEAVREHYGQMHWTARIRKALEENRFKLYQQPIVGVIDNEIDSFEVLIRLIDEGKKIVPPGAFIPAAERYGLMPDIDRWVIREVFKYIFEAKSSARENVDASKYAINLSGNSIKDPTFLDYIFEQKDKYNISLKQICFEITETVAIGNLTKASKFINELKSHGCMFALDDFGSGLSSFAYLKTLPVDFLKIDGGFVKDISSDKIDRAMVESIQQVGKVMSLRTIAEHVEDESTLAILREIGVDYAQGYYLGRPWPLN